MGARLRRVLGRASDPGCSTASPPAGAADVAPASSPWASAGGSSGRLDAATASAASFAARAMRAASSWASIFSERDPKRCRFRSLSWCSSAAMRSAISIRSASSA